MRTIAALVCALSLALSLAGCGGGRVQEVPEDPDPVEVPSDPGSDGIPEEGPEEEPEEDEMEDGDRILASLDGGQAVRVDLIGRSDTAGCQIREIRAYLDGRRIQTIRASEIAPEDPITVLTAPSPEDAVEVHDVDFDGLDDLDIIAPTDPGPDGPVHVWWLWDPDASVFRYGASMEGASLHEDTREISVSYAYSADVDFTDWYRWEEGSLVLSRRRSEDWRNGTEDFPLTAWYTFAPDGSQVLERQEFTDYDGHGQVVREVRISSDGILVPVLRERLESDGMGGWIAVSSDPILPEEVEDPSGYDGPDAWLYEDVEDALWG